MTMPSINFIKIPHSTMITNSVKLVDGRIWVSLDDTNTVSRIYIDFDGKRYELTSEFLFSKITNLIEENERLNNTLNSLIPRIEALENFKSKFSIEEKNDIINFTVGGDTVD